MNEGPEPSANESAAHELFARCHDGLASPAERARFDAELARSPALAAEFELQRHIDARLGALFGAHVDSNAALDLAALEATVRTRRRAREWPRGVLFAAAAALLLSWCLDAAPRAARARDGRTWSEFYAALEFEPPLAGIEACTAWTASPGQRVLADDLPLELDADCAVTRASDAGLAGARAWWITCGAQRSLVVVGDARSTPPIALAPGSGLALDVREIGPWRCQELARPAAGGVLARLRWNEHAARK